MNMKHPNSREITIFRTKSFLENAQGAEAAEYMASSKKSIGSYFVGAGSSRIASGLDFYEEALLLPLILSVPESHPDFRKKVDEYYINISTNIPAKHGATFETGLQKQNGKRIADDVITKDNLPLNLEQYLKFRHAIKHPEVAGNKEEGNAISWKQYYIFNPYELQAKKVEDNEAKDEAMGLFLALRKEAEKGDKMKLDIMLTLLGKDPREFTSKEPVKEKENALRELAMSDPHTFRSTYESGDLNERYWLKTLNNLEIIRQIQGRYVDMETKQAIANNEQEMLFWFKDEDNSDAIGMYKARAQEKMMEAPKAARVRKTQALPGKTLGSGTRI
jgi:hypothetical protein